MVLAIVPTSVRLRTISKRISALVFFSYSILGLGATVFLGRALATYSGDVNSAHLPGLLILAGSVVVLITSTVCGLVLIVTVDHGYLGIPAFLVALAAVWWLSTAAYPVARITGETILAVHLVLVVFGTWRGGEEDVSGESLHERMGAGLD